MIWEIEFESESLQSLEAGMKRGYIIELAEERDDGLEYAYFEKAAVGTLGGFYPDGGLKKWFKNIKKWHKQNKGELISAWNAMRPEGCPVGPINC